MNWKNPALHVLGLDAKEKEILLSLRDPLSIQDLARKSPIPRTTLAYIIKKLVKRGFIEKVKLGKRHKYYSITQERLKSLLEGAHTMKIKTHNSTSPLISTLDSKKLFYHKGLVNIVRLQAEFLNSYENERVYAIQPNKSWLSLHSKVDDERVIHVNNIIRNNNLIIDAIIEHDAYQKFKKVTQSRKKFIRLTKSFGDRMADYVSAPKGYLTDQVEMWLIKNSALFIDWQEEVAIKIVDAHMVNFLKDMFLLTKEQGQKIDHNQAIREVMI